MLDVLVLYSQCEAASVEDRPMVMASACAALLLLCSVQGGGLHQHQRGLLRQSHAHVVVEAQNLHAPVVSEPAQTVLCTPRPSSKHGLCKTGATCMCRYCMKYITCTCTKGTADTSDGCNQLDAKKMQAVWLLTEVYDTQVITSHC